MVSTAGGTPEPADAPDVLLPGAKAGPWVIERELGRGGMGTVYAVVHEEIGKRAALKLVHRRLLTPAFQVERVLLEAKVVNAVGHPGIVDIFETGTLGDGRPYIVMERLEGQPLSYRADDGKILPDQVIAILLQICDALIAAHAASVVHRDLKLDNIFLVDNPDAPGTPKVKLLDWGIAKVIDQDVRHTIEGQLVGTPQYLAPEQARGAAVSPRTDVYSLGVMAYELFLEQLPFEAETSAEIMAMHLRAVPPAPSELWPEIPASLEDLLLRMLAKQPDDRPTMLEVARRLEAVRGELAGRRRGDSALVVPIAAPIALEDARPLRPSSRAGLAPTVPAESARWRPRPPPSWQLAAGALVVAAGATLFAVAGDADSHPVDAAGAYDQLITTAPLPHPVDQIARQFADRVGPAERGQLGAAATASTSAAAPSSVMSVGLAGEASPALPRPTSPRAIAPPARLSTRKAPAAPRRTAAHIDPDGTIDPY